jgi:hypothetical protein
LSTAGGSGKNGALSAKSVERMVSQMGSNMAKMSSNMAEMSSNMHTTSVNALASLVTSPSEKSGQDADGDQKRKAAPSDKSPSVGGSPDHRPEIVPDPPLGFPVCPSTNKICSQCVANWFNKRESCGRPSHELYMSEGKTSDEIATGKPRRPVPRFCVPRNKRSRLFCARCIKYWIDRQKQCGDPAHRKFLEEGPRPRQVSQPPIPFPKCKEDPGNDCTWCTKSWREEGKFCGRHRHFRISETFYENNPEQRP